MDHVYQENSAHDRVCPCFVNDWLSADFLASADESWLCGMQAADRVLLVTQQPAGGATDLKV